MVGYHAVVHVHDKQGHAQRKGIGQQGRQQHVAIERPAFGDDAPEPVLVAAGAHLRCAGVVALGGTGIDGGAGVTGLQRGQRHGDRGFVEFGVDHLGGVARLVQTQHHAGPSILQQRHGGQQGVVESGQRRLHQLTAQMRAQCGTGKKTGCEAGVLSRQPCHQSVTAGSLTMGTRHNLQANQQFVHSGLRRRWHA